MRETLNNHQSGSEREVRALVNRFVYHSFPAREFSSGSPFFAGDVVTVVDAKGIPHSFKDPYQIECIDGTLEIGTVDEVFSFPGFQSFEVGPTNHPTISPR